MIVHGTVTKIDPKRESICPRTNDKSEMRTGLESEHSVIIGRFSFLED